MIELTVTHTIILFVSNIGESDIALTKSKIKSTVEEYNKNWRNEDTTQIKYHRHHKRKLKSELLRLEGMCKITVCVDTAPDCSRSELHS